MAPSPEDEPRTDAGTSAYNTTGGPPHVTIGPVEDNDGVTLLHARRGDTLEIEIVTADTTLDTATVDTKLVDQVAQRIREILGLAGAQGATVHLAADHPPDQLAPLAEAVADRAGFGARRDLVQLRRTLPFPGDHPARSGPQVETRPIVTAGPDEAAWVRANNRAFAHHADQGRESIATLHARMAEPWFDPTGFLVADDANRPGELSGFCWTKVQLPQDGDAMLGEIYVIGVDPAHRGERLGPAFVLAGLDHLAGRGIATSVLYVDADNGPAVRLYDQLGFTTHARRRVYTRPGAVAP